MIVEPKRCSVTLRGSDMEKMRTEADRQFQTAYQGTNWLVTGVNARLDMISVGAGNEWLPGEWAATFHATEVT